MEGENESKERESKERESEKVKECKNVKAGSKKGAMT